MVLTANAAYLAWTAKVSYDQVLQRANTSKNLPKVIVSRQTRFVDHVTRMNQLEAVALTGMIESKRARGRQRKRSWTGYLPHVEINGTSTKF